MFHVAMHFKKRPVDGSKMKHSYYERGTNMARQTYADNVDANGKVFKTVGDNIRMGARAGELIDFSTITDADKDRGCSTNSVINRIVAPTTQTIKNLNIISDQRQALKYAGDLWFENDWLYIERSSGTQSVVVSQGETITNIEDATTTTIETVITKLNELITALRKTKIIR